MYLQSFQCLQFFTLLSLNLYLNVFSEIFWASVWPFTRLQSIFGPYVLVKIRLIIYSFVKLLKCPNFPRSKERTLLKYEGDVAGTVIQQLASTFHFSYLLCLSLLSIKGLSFYVTFLFLFLFCFVFFFINRFGKKIA